MVNKLNCIQERAAVNHRTAVKKSLSRPLCAIHFLRYF